MQVIIWCAVLVLSLSMPAMATSLSISGTPSYSISGTALSASASVKNNDSSASGTIRLEVWAFPSNFTGGALSGYKLADEGALASSLCGGCVRTRAFSGPFAAPPSGTWTIAVVWTELDGSATNGGFSARTFFNFAPLTFGTPPTPLPSHDYSDLWWNPNESGWGVVVMQHASNIAFVAWYTYDSVGNPKWYVGPNCPLVGDGCTSELYETSGPPFGPTFDPHAVSVRDVGSVTFAFTDKNNGTMSYNVRGSAAVKTITRQTY